MKTPAFHCKRCTWVLGYSSADMLLRPRLVPKADGTLALEWDRVTGPKVLHCPNCGQKRTWAPLNFTKTLDEHMSVPV